MKRFLVSIVISSLIVIATACSNTSSNVKPDDSSSLDIISKTEDSSTIEATSTENLFEEPQPVTNVGVNSYTPSDFTPEDLEVILTRTDIDPYKTVTEYVGYAPVELGFNTYVPEDQFYIGEDSFDMDAFLAANGCERYFLSGNDFLETPVDKEDPYLPGYLITCWYGGRWRVILPLGTCGQIDCGVWNSTGYYAVRCNIWTIPSQDSKYYWIGGYTPIKLIGYDEDYTYTKAALRLFAEAVRCIKSNPENVLPYYYMAPGEGLNALVDIDYRNIK